MRSRDEQGPFSCIRIAWQGGRKVEDLRQEGRELEWGCGRSRVWGHWISSDPQNLVRASEGDTGREPSRPHSQLGAAGP